jgi:cob(I)alamin adenosyltransferase
MSQDPTESNESNSENTTDQDRFSDPKLAINRVYTRHGDQGETRLVGGQKVSKADLRIESYGTVDELNAYIGAARLSCLEIDCQELADVLYGVQNALFNLGSLLATKKEDLHPLQPQVTSEDVVRLEQTIDHYNQELPELRSFVLPGGNRPNVELHMARTICRRAERICVRLASLEDIGEQAIPYLNRLSDALFVWSRWVVYYQKLEEHLWTPNKS